MREYIKEEYTCTYDKLKPGKTPYWGSEGGVYCYGSIDGKEYIYSDGSTDFGQISLFKVKELLNGNLISYKYLGVK